MNEILQRFWNDELGAETVEWAAVTAILVVMTVPFVIVLKNGVLDLFQQAFSAVQRPPEPDYP